MADNRALRGTLSLVAISAALVSAVLGIYPFPPSAGPTAGSSTCPCGTAPITVGPPVVDHVGDRTWYNMTLSPSAGLLIDEVALEVETSTEVPIPGNATWNASFQTGPGAFLANYSFPAGTWWGSTDATLSAGDELSLGLIGTDPLSGVGDTLDLTAYTLDGWQDVSVSIP